MPWGAAVVAAGAIGGAVIQSRGAKKAAQASVDASSYAANLQQQQYDQSRADMAPWRESGSKALGELNNLMYSKDRAAALRDRPGYQFRLDEGLRALSRTAAAGSRTGRLYRSMVDYGQNTAADEYMNEFNRLSGMAGTGQSATMFSAQQGANSAALQGGYAQRAGDMRGSAYMGQAAIMGNALGGLASAGMGAMGGMGAQVMGGGNFASDYVPPGGSFGQPNPYAGAGGYGDNWTSY